MLLKRCAPPHRRPLNSRGGRPASAAEQGSTNRCQGRAFPRPHPTRSRYPAPRECAPPKESCAAAIPWSWRVLVQQNFDADACPALLQPAVGLLVDGTLYQCFLNEVARVFERWRRLSAGFRPRHHAGLVKLLDRFLINLDHRPEAAIQVVAEIKLRPKELPDLVVGQATELLACLEFLRRGERSLQTLEASSDLVFGWLRKARN